MLFANFKEILVSLNSLAYHSDSQRFVLGKRSSLNLFPVVMRFLWQVSWKGLELL